MLRMSGFALLEAVTVETVAYVLVLVVGLGLMMSGLVYQVQRERLHADPVLVNSCYLFGGLLVASCLV